MYYTLVGKLEGFPPLDIVQETQQAWSMLEGKLGVAPGRSLEIVDEMHRAWVDSHLVLKKPTCFRGGLGVSDPRDMMLAHIGFAGGGKKKIVEEKPAVDYSKTCV
jgi:hypothetical protein